ncbi:MAG: response regulator [Deltaproteobacteria bacterium]|nr:response regulator [Deltaproteobacteria bacterium]
MTHNPAGDSNAGEVPPEAIEQSIFKESVIKGPKRAQVPPKILDTKACPANRGARVLFIDDEEMVARMGKRTLSQLGYTVTTMTNSEEALFVFSQDPIRFDIVITDQTMPGLTGIVLAKEMLAIRPDIPIILATGYNEQVDENSSRAAGVRKYVKKPIEIRVLAQIIEQLLE